MKNPESIIVATMMGRGSTKSKAARLPNIDTVITGHYHTTLTMADLMVYGDFIREFVEAVQAAKRDGRTVDDFVAAWKIPERYLKEGYASTEHLRSIRSDVAVIWNETK